MLREVSILFIVPYFFRWQVQFKKQRIVWGLRSRWGKINEYLCTRYCQRVKNSFTEVGSHQTFEVHLRLTCVWTGPVFILRLFVPSCHGNSKTLNGRSTLWKVESFLVNAIIPSNPLKPYYQRVNHLEPQLAIYNSYRAIEKRGFLFDDLVGFVHSACRHGVLQTRTCKWGIYQSVFG